MYDSLVRFFFLRLQFVTAYFVALCFLCTRGSDGDLGLLLLGCVFGTVSFAVAWRYVEKRKAQRLNISDFLLPAPLLSLALILMTNHLQEMGGMLIFIAPIAALCALGIAIPLRYLFFVRMPFAPVTPDQDIEE